MARMSKADWQFVREAINHAIEERDGFRDAYTPRFDATPDADTQAVLDRCDRFIERAEAFCQKHFGRSSDIAASNERLNAMPRVSIFELRDQPKPEQEAGDVRG